MLIKHRKKTDSGFTLIEVLVVIVIIGLIAAIGTPSFNNWRQNANVNADMRRLYGFFQKARIEAVKQNETCSIVLTETGYRSTVGAEVIDSGAYSNGVKMTGSTGGLNLSYDSRGLFNNNVGTTITLKRKDQEFEATGYKHDLVISARGRMRIK